MKSMFHMLHYISIIQLVLKSSTLIIYCASCKWSIHMEPSFSTFLMLFPGYKLQENISYLKEGNALNECRRGILHKGGHQEPPGKKGLQPGLWDVWCQRISASSALWDVTDPAAWWNHPSTKIPSALNKMVAQAGTSSLGRTTPGCALEVPSDFEKFALRTLKEVARPPWPPPKPFSRGFAPIKKRIRGSPSSLTEVQPLPGLGRSHLQSHTGFLHCVEDLRGHFKMATKFS